ncbi:MAG: cyclic nucleotide-binding domain-containing protein [Dehalococcoidia bacterium]|nr:cyclic nucleotide-binding domain-containing protein [Dehalococcoidia bacterium]
MTEHGDEGEQGMDVPEQSNQSPETAHPVVVAIGRNRLLRMLDAEQRQALLAAAAWHQAPAEAVLARQGAPVDRVLFLVQGRARAEMDGTARGRGKILVNTLAQGDEIGLLSIIDGAPHAATVTAIEPVVAFSLGVTTLRSFLDAHPACYRPLAEIAVARLQTSARWVGALTLAPQYLASRRAGEAIAAPEQAA